jgi:hypothetical protein
MQGIRKVKKIVDGFFSLSDREFDADHEYMPFAVFENLYPITKSEKPRSTLKSEKIKFSNKCL